MPYYSFNMKKGKYQIEMRSDDVYFANRQVGRLFEKLLKVQGKLKVVLPTIDSKKVMNETKEVENQTIVKEIIQKSINPEKKVEIAKTIITPTEIIEPVEEIIQETVIAPVKKAIIEEKIIEPAEEIIQETVIAPVKKAVIEEKIIEPAEEIIQETVIAPVKKAVIEEKIIEPAEEIIQETVIAPVKETVIEEIPEKTLFESILEEKTSEIIEEEEEPLLKTPRVKKTFSFKSITNKFNTPQSEDLPVKQKAGFKSSQSQENETGKKIIQGLIFPDEEEQEVAAYKRQTSSSESNQSEYEVFQSEFIELPEEPEEIIQERFLDFEEVKVEKKTLTIYNFESPEDLIEIKKPESKLDYLLLTAYYLQNKQNLFKYSLKQINSKSMPFLGSLIDHSVIHNAVAHGFIEVVPDYNGSAEVTEYSLTLEGENYFLNEL